MLAQTDIERASYEARRKGQLDYTTDMRAERRIGRAEGRAAATIRLLQRILKQSVTTEQTLQAMTAAELAELEATLTAAARQAGIEL